MVDATLAALAELPDDVRARRAPGLRHPLDPDAMNDAQRPATAAPTSPSTAASPPRSSSGCARRPATGYPHRAGLLLAVRAAARAVARARRQRPPRGARRATGVAGVVVVPIGFVSDHMEVVYDLDTEALATAERLGLPFARAATAGRRPAVRGDGARPAARAGRGRARRASPTRAVVGGLARVVGPCARPAAAPTRAATRPALCGARPDR